MPTMLVPDVPESLRDTPSPAAAEDTRSLDALLAGYVASDASRHDMLFDAGGELRPHWRELLEEFAVLGEQGLAERGDEVQRLLYENGVTFNVHDDQRGRLRTWRVDPLPLVIPAEQWRELEAGLIQRSRLLDALLADIYGPRRLIEEGYLPPELIYEHPGFLFACDHSQGDTPRAGLIFHGVDLVLDDRGQWRVVADRSAGAVRRRLCAGESHHPRPGDAYALPRGAIAPAGKFPRDRASRPGCAVVSAPRAAQCGPADPGAR